MKTILVTGANGQLGNSIRLLASQHPQYNFLFTDVDTLDITDPVAVKAAIKDNQVNYILNCAAYTAVDKAEDDEALCRRLNCYAVHVLGEAAREPEQKSSMSQPTMCSAVQAAVRIRRPTIHVRLLLMAVPSWPVKKPWWKFARMR